MTYGVFRAVVQSDGNIVVYRDTFPVWSSGTPGNSGARLRLQTDGNLVLYAASGYPIWSTFSSGGVRLVLQEDGNLVLYRANGSVAWNRFADTSRRIPLPPANPGDSVNCSNFSTWRDAQDWFNRYYPYYGDIAKLDGNNDGIACETLPGHP